MFLLFDYLFGLLIRSLAYGIGSARNLWQSRGSARSPRIKAVVLADPVQFGLTAKAVEIVYSYRVEGELYTGIHEQPCFYSEEEYLARFVKGTKFVVRVRPGEPTISVICDADQGQPQKAPAPV